MNVSKCIILTFIKNFVNTTVLRSTHVATIPKYIENFQQILFHFVRELLVTYGRYRIFFPTKLSRYGLKTSNRKKKKKTDSEKKN